MSSDCFVCIVLYCHAYCIVVLIVDDEMSGNQEKSETQKNLSVEEEEKEKEENNFLGSFCIIFSNKKRPFFGRFSKINPFLGTSSTGPNLSFASIKNPKKSLQVAEIARQRLPFFHLEASGYI